MKRMEETLYAANLRAGHIEQPKIPFFVRFHHRSYKPDGMPMRYPAKDCLVRILAESEQGALKVAQYHYFIHGENFRLVRLKKPELVRYTTSFAVKYEIQQKSAQHEPEVER